MRSYTPTLYAFIKEAPQKETIYFRLYDISTCCVCRSECASVEQVDLGIVILYWFQKKGVEKMNRNTKYYVPNYYRLLRKEFNDWVYVQKLSADLSFQW